MAFVLCSRASPGGPPLPRYSTPQKTALKTEDWGVTSSALRQPRVPSGMQGCLWGGQTVGRDTAWKGVWFPP